MLRKQLVLACCCAFALALAGCSRQQSDWQKTRENNTAEAYEQFVKKYPSGEFTAQAQSRLKDLYDVRDWQKARDADTPEAYQAYLNQYPDGQSAAEARNRLENFSMAQTPAAAAAVPGAPPPSAAGESSEAQPGADTGTAPPPAVRKPAAPAVAPPAAAASHAKPSAKHEGEFAVQLGAFRSGSGAAKKRWEHLQKEYPQILAGLSSKVVPKKTASGTLYRLQAAGVSEGHARRICKDLKAKSQPCVIVRVEHT
jgi:cell division protein FtsN